jgi:integrase
MHEMKLKKRSKMDKSLSDATKRKIIGVTNSIFHSAIEWGYLSSNPCNNIKLKSPQQTELEFWNNEQLNYFLDLNYGTKYYLPFLVLATTGMRRGEVCAMKWKNFDG